MMPHNMTYIENDCFLRRPHRQRYENESETSIRDSPTWDAHDELMG